MCGRFDFHGTTQDLTEAFGDIVVPPDVGPLAAHYNIAPTQQAAILRGNTDGALELATLPFGWTKAQSGGLLINARHETVARQPALRREFTLHRCIVPANGFYEWRLEGKRKQPYYFHPKEAPLLAFAAVWRPGNAAGFVILTTRPNGDVGPIHHRMPVVLTPQNARDYVLSDIPPRELAAMLGPLQDGWLTSHPVSMAVNNARHDTPECIEPWRA